MKHRIILNAMKKAEQKEEKVQELKKELNKRKTFLDGVTKDFKETKNSDSEEEKRKIIKRIEKNKKVMEKFLNILEKNQKMQED
ncbi:MAG: hypothetical protein R6U96_06075 [Promethearchaeia archaeon]